jgi:hypothetical protein
VSACASGCLDQERQRVRLPELCDLNPFVFPDREGWQQTYFTFLINWFGATLLFRRQNGEAAGGALKEQAFQQQVSSS